MSDKEESPTVDLAAASAVGPFPTRISVTTFNIWGSNCWPERSMPLCTTLLTLKSDIYMLQEVTPDIIEVLDKNLSKYSRVHDEKVVGWNSESNIYWNTELFDMLDHGFGDLEMEDYPNRGLFWVRLALKSNPAQTLFCSTAHFPWVGCDTELATGMNQRIPAATKLCEHWRRLVPPDECAIFGGDLNDDFHPVRILNEELGMLDVFESLDLPPPTTHPVRPSDFMEEMRPNRTLDWLLCSLPAPSRVVAALAKANRGGRFPPISDHLPVMAIFELYCSKQMPERSLFA